MGDDTNNRVLIIDDDLTTKAILEDILHSHGFDTRHAGGGKEGLAIVREWNPSVILLDLVMPEMDGTEVCSAIRSMKLPQLPSIIIISMRGDKKIIADSLSKGADDFIVKPIDELELLARIRAQLRIREFYREIENDKRTLETILDITNAISATLDTARVLEIIVSKVAELTHAIRCSILLIVKSTEGYVLASHEDPNIRNLKLDLSKYPEIQEVINTKRPLVIEDMASHPLLNNVKDLVKELRDMSALIVPIVFNDEVMGTLFLRAKRKGKGFTPKEIRFCQIVSNSSYYAIKNAQLFEKTLKEKERLGEMAIRDQLTTLYNHNFFYNRLDEEFERAVRYNVPLSILMMDIDDFKRINDSYGHRVGDHVLKELARIIKKMVRKSDILARYGGEEFALILPHTGLKGAVEEAERIRKIVESHSYAGLKLEQVTMSIGVASYPKEGVKNSGDLVNLADNALYMAKAEGKNRVKSV